MLILHLFVSYVHVNLYHFFSSTWYRGLAAAFACGSSWTFLFTFFSPKSRSMYTVYTLANIYSNVHAYGGLPAIIKYFFVEVFSHNSH